jgi:anti-anti-sigma factor
VTPPRERVEADMGEAFKVATDNGDGYVLVSVVGELDVATAPQLRNHLNKALGGGRQTAVLDLTGVTFVDSTALGVLIEANKLCDANGGTMRIAASESRVLKVFEITGLTELFDIRPTRSAAIAG